MSDEKGDQIQEEDLFENVDGWQVGVEEMKSLYRLQFESVDIRKDQAKTILGASSIVIAILGALQLVGVQVVAEWLYVYNAAIVLAVGLYVASIVLCFLALDAVTLIYPVEDDWDTIYEHFGSQETDLDLAKKLLVSYLGAIEENRPTLIRHSLLVRWASILLPVVVVILLLLSLIPRVPVV